MESDGKKNPEQKDKDADGIWLINKRTGELLFEPYILEVGRRFQQQKRREEERRTAAAGKGQNAGIDKAHQKH